MGTRFIIKSSDTTRFTSENWHLIWEDINKLLEAIHRWEPIKLNSPVIICEVSKDFPGEFSITIKNLFLASGHRQAYHALNNIMSHIGILNRYCITNIAVGLLPPSPYAAKMSDLHIAVDQNDIVTAKKLLEESHYPDVCYEKDNIQITPLILACQKGSYEMIDLLLQHGASVKRKFPSSQMMPLHFAILAHTSFSVIELLLKNHFQLEAVTGEVALALAIKQLDQYPQKEEAEKIISLLLSYGTGIGADLTGIPPYLLENQVIIGAKNIPKGCCRPILNTDDFFQLVSPDDWKKWLSQLRMLSATSSDKRIRALVHPIMKKLAKSASLDGMITEKISARLITGTSSSLYYRGNPTKLGCSEIANHIRFNFFSNNASVLPDELAHTIFNNISVKRNMAKENTLSLLRDAYQKGKSCLGKRDYPKAVLYFQTVLDLRIKYHGGLEYIEVAQSYHNLGCAYQGMQDYQTAIYVFKRAASIYADDKFFGIHQDKNIEELKYAGKLDKKPQNTIDSQFYVEQAIDFSVMGLNNKESEASANCSQEQRFHIIERIQNRGVNAINEVDERLRITSGM